MGRRLKLRDLYVLKTVVQRGSMGKAATQLAISQPAVSKAIADLEQVLGVRLLERTRQGVEPTPYGTALLKWSAAVFDDLRQGVAEIDFLADPTAGRVRVGTSEGMPAGIGFGGNRSVAAAISALNIHGHPSGNKCAAIP